MAGSKIEEIESCYARYHTWQGWLITLAFYIISCIFLLFLPLYFSLDLVPKHGLFLKNEISLQFDTLSECVGILEFNTTERTSDQNNTLTNCIPSDVLLTNNETIIDDWLLLEEQTLYSELSQLLNNSNFLVLWNISLAVTLICTFLLSVSFVLFTYNAHQNNPLFKGKPLIFVVMMHVSVIGFFLSSLLLTGIMFLQIGGHETNRNTIVHYYYFSFTCVRIFAGLIYCTLIGRQRCVYLCLQPVRVELSQWSLFQVYPVCFLFFSISGIIFTIVSYGPDMNWGGFDFSVLFDVIVFCFLFPSWLGYYTWNARHGSQKYSDYFVNLRIVVTISLTMCVVFIYRGVDSSSSVPYLLSQYAMLWLGTSYFVDSLLPIVYASYALRGTDFLFPSSNTSRSRTQAASSKLSRKETGCSATSSEVLSTALKNDGDDFDKDKVFILS